MSNNDNTQESILAGVQKLTGLELLRSPFPPHQISKLPKPTKSQTDAVKADYKKGIRCQLCGAWHHPDVVHLDYVGHAALTDRLLDADQNWNWEPLALSPVGLPLFDSTGGLWIKLTVCGVTRFGYGNAENSSFKDAGSREKEVIGDALRNAGMRFGAALDLWHKGDLHLDPDPEKKEAKPAASPKAPAKPSPVTSTKLQEPAKTPPIDNHAPIGMARSVELKTKIKELSATWTNEKVDQLAMLEYGKQPHELTQSKAQAMLNYCKNNPVKEVQ